MCIQRKGVLNVFRVLSKSFREFLKKLSFVFENTDFYFPSSAAVRRLLGEIDGTSMLSFQISEFVDLFVSII